MAGRRTRRRKQKQRELMRIILTALVIVSVGVLLLLLVNKGIIKRDDSSAKNPGKTEISTVTQVPNIDVGATATSEAMPTEEPTKGPEPTSTAKPTATPEPTPFPTPESEPLVFSSSDMIPVISVKTEGEQPIISREEYLNCEVTVGNVDSEFEMRDVKAGIRVRGNSSAYYGDVEKILANEVPYRIKFEKKQNLLGLNDGNKFKSWVLLRADKGLVRDDMAFRFGRLFLGDGYYCSDARWVHLYVNDEFKGVYLLCEQSQVNENRIEVNEPEPGETGTQVGYLLEIDNNAGGEDNPYFRMNYENVKLTDIHGVVQQITYANYSIKSETTSDAQVDFISEYMRNMFRLVYEACVKKNYLMFDEEYNLVPATYDNCKDTIEAVMDTESVAAMYLVFEIMRDRDGGEGSFYMCVDFSENSKYPKLTFLCPWDFDWTCQGDATGRYYAAGFDDPDFVEKYGDRSNPWFIMLAQEEWFMDIVREKWNTLQKDGLVYACIEEERQNLEFYKEDLNRKSKIATATATALLDWMERRVGWLDEEWLY